MATARREFYDVLGVSRTASQDDIKKAFRRLARQYHPDLHTGTKKTEMEAKFKELNEAHEVLSDPEKRKKYDQYGHQWREAEAYERARREAGAGPGPTWQAGPEFQAGGAADFSDIFEQFFGGRAGGGTTFRGFAMPGADLETTVRLTLREVSSGTSRRLRLEEPVPCETCGGTGRQGSRGCTRCKGTGTASEAKTIAVKIPAGVQDGTRVRVPGKGAPGRGGAPRGDLYLLIQVEPDRIFHRQGDDLEVTLPVWPWEALLGADVLAPTLTDPVRVKIPPGSRSGSKLRLKGKGLPTQSGSRGDLLFTLHIVVPDSVSEEERRLYDQLAKASHPDPRAELLRKAGHG